MSETSSKNSQYQYIFSYNDIRDFVTPEEIQAVAEGVCETMIQNDVYLDQELQCFGSESSFERMVFRDICYNDIYEYHDKVAAQGTEFFYPQFWTPEQIKILADYYTEKQIPFRAIPLSLGKTKRTGSITYLSTDYYGVKMTASALVFADNDEELLEGAKHEYAHVFVSEFLKSKSDRIKYEYESRQISAAGILEEINHMGEIIFPQDLEDAEKEALAKRFVRFYGNEDLIAQSDMETLFGLRYFLNELVAAASEMNHDGFTRRFPDEKSPSYAALLNPELAKQPLQILVLASLKEFGLWDDFVASPYYDAEIIAQINPDDIEFVGQMMRRAADWFLEQGFAP
ncbi:MAG: hypothetical protein H7A33_02995 [Deltaproteobacteria bacterium]|nr:hypothetical protein [Deltaproteobacteria bacterium]